MAAERMFVSVTGQSQQTIRFMQLTIRADEPAIRHIPQLVDPRMVFIISQYYNYRIKMLQDLSPNSPDVQNPPYNNLPPPHLLLGYFYACRTINNYNFDNRTLFQIGFVKPIRQVPSRLYWRMMVDCGYNVDVGRYMRFLDLANFDDTFTRMHNSVLMDRVAADMGNVYMVGRGFNDDSASRTLSGHGASGIQDNTLLRISSAKDATLLCSLKHLRLALCNYLFCLYYDIFNTQEIYRFLPGSEVYAQGNWLNIFTQTFSVLNSKDLMESINSDNNLFDEPARVMTQCLILSLSEESDPTSLLSGGAMQLRNRRIVARPGLRSRDARGRAITSSAVRRTRARTVREFVDRLPRRTRQRAHVRPPSPMELEEIEPEIEMEEEDEESRFIREVIATIQNAMSAINDELSERARNHQLFTFARQFYTLLISAQDRHLVTEAFLRKWVLYFFLSEHIASTMYYLYSHFIENRNFRRFVDIEVVQIVIRGWDNNGENVFKRIWSEHEHSAVMFETLFSRVLRDFLTMIEKTGQIQDMDEQEQMMFLSNIQYRDRSGDVEEVLRQLNLNEENIDGVDISIRIKFKGVCAISTNNRIIANLQRQQI
ncbi:terminal protein precursor pTP [Crane-associated adenovirus 1]|uniref:Terminal protein pTP n=1 Tax=Crane-associated adenovirus 1 TaxID=2559941 RepID=A0A5H2X6N2_9ADEN|nr:terminal protein precursor pTP [Crane-associated adenovirus 1]